ncbi:hypothetical protein PGT21_027065 [Puccinia graminis f. sp. tritici]|nr:hypothetical protein PGT21_027065 [Puccinia graminis f. sp. tritici]
MTNDTHQLSKSQRWHHGSGPSVWHEPFTDPFAGFSKSEAVGGGRYLSEPESGDLSRLMGAADGRNDTESKCLAAPSGRHETLLHNPSKCCLSGSGA